MDIIHDEELRADFKQILIDLSKSEDALKDETGKKKRSDYYQKLERLYYDENFIHYSSDIFFVLTQIQNGLEKGSLDVLGQNIKLIRQGYQKKNKSPDGEFKDIETNIRKLYDDLNIEIARLLSNKADSWKFSQENKVRQLNEEIEKAHCRLSKSEKKMTEFEKKIESSQKEYIAILGIFAAIVLAFTGGITFSTSVLENMHRSSIYRIVLVILLIGFTLVNILCLLFMFIDKLVHGNVRVISKVPLIVFDAIVIAFVVIVLFAWRSGLVEVRDKDVNANISQTESSSIKTELPDEGLSSDLNSSTIE